MKNKIEYFFEKANIFLVYLVSVPFSIIVWYVMWHLMQALFSMIDTSPALVVPFFVYLIIGFIFGGFMTLMIHLMREASKFYDLCDEIEKRIELAKTKKELEDILEEFPQLMKYNHYTQTNLRLKELMTIIKTKWKYI